MAKVQEAEKIAKIIYTALKGMKYSGRIANESGTVNIPVFSNGKDFLALELIPQKNSIELNIYKISPKKGYEKEFYSQVNKPYN